MTDSTVTFETPIGGGGIRKSLIYKKLQQLRDVNHVNPPVQSDPGEHSSSLDPLAWEEKFEEWKKAAEDGDPEGQSQLGTCYYFGDGVPQDLAEAVKWFRNAASQGNAEAQCRLGLCYDTGTGVLQNKTEAAEWYRKAAEQGHPDAMHLLGDCYYYGWGVPKNEEEAAKWLRKAHDQGVDSAVSLLRRMGR